MADIEKIKRLWKTKGRGLVMPKIVLAYDKNMQDYFVYEDSSTILYLYLNKSNSAFVIPKKYTHLDADERYRILDNFKLINISCNRKNKYQLFVEENLVF